MRSRSLVLALLGLLLVVPVALAGLQPAAARGPVADRRPGAEPASRQDQWAPAATATLTPGVMAVTDRSGQCTANFVHTDAAGGVYLGYAAHCASLGTASDTDGCATRSLPLGTGVTFVRGASLVGSGTRLGSGTLVYSSWVTMRRLGVTDPDVCAYNDFALVKVDERDVAKVNPSIPHLGGPTGVGEGSLALGDRVLSYGNSSLRAGVAALSPKYGIALGDDPEDSGWSHPVFTLTPGVPGDSGSGVVNAAGRAVGTLSTVVLTPTPGANKLGDYAAELAFAQRFSGIEGLQLTRGTVAFSGRR